MVLRNTRNKRVARTRERLGASGGWWRSYSISVLPENGAASGVLLPKVFYESRRRRISLPTSRHLSEVLHLKSYPDTIVTERDNRTQNDKLLLSRK